MSDSESPQPSPERDPGSSGEGPVSSSPEQGVQSPAQSVVESQGTDGDSDSQATTPLSSLRDRLGSVKHLVQNRKGVWAAVAVFCVAAGAVGSLLGAHAVARTDDAKARQAFHL